MLNLFNAQIEQLSLHKVGNKNKNEALLLSQEQQHLNDELQAVLKEYFFKPFREKEENYFKFHHEVDLSMNDVYGSATNIFNDHSNLHSESCKIATHLYSISVHPHIKSGEVYVVHFSNVSLDNEKTEALGIFKSEVKQDFMEFNESGSNLDLDLRKGVNLHKLDKGCLIFNNSPEEGYKVLTVDGNRYDTKYWPLDFLGLEPLTDDNFYTSNYLKFCQNFAKDVVLPAEDKQQEVLFMNKAVNHFAQNDDFEETKFLNDVMDNPELIPEFKHYKVEKGPKYSIEDVSSFGIENTAVSTARKKIKNTISLDTNVQIKLDFINPESAEKFIEKGWDEERQMYYYLVYFNQEKKN